LDPLIRSEMQDQLIELQEKLHKTIVFITHDLDEALRIGDRIAILKDGALIQEGAPEDILLEPATDYIENFVRDVNRARALTVKTVMKPPVLRITAETIGEALAEMRKSPRDYAYYETDEGYQGVLLQETLEEALEDKSPINEDSKICAQVLEDVPAISSDDYLEAVLTGTLESEVPLPVLNEDGAVYGQISRKTLASALEPPVSEDQEAEEQQQDASAQDQNKEAS
jgi:glycine betaine/proline transport system ATP-binding protein